jgi:hypothetical protein
LFESFVFLILIFSPVFTYWMLSGTENAFQISTLLAALLAFKKKRFVIGSFLLGLHGIIRFEAVVISGLVLIQIIISKRQLLFRTNKVAIYLGLVLIPFLMNTVFRWLYYDSLTPNTGVRKFFERSFQTRLIEGAAYVGNFLIETHIIIMLIVLLGFYWFKRAFIREDLGLLVIAALWLLVVAFVGGDVNWKPRFRFCTGPFVLFTLFFAKSLFVSRRVGQYCLALWIGLILLVEPVFFEAKSFGFCQKKFRKYALGANTNLLTVVANNPRIDLIRGNLMDDSFKAVGRLISVLGFEGTLLTTGAGKVAFYSNMHAIDATGLADKEWRDGDRANRSKMLNEVNVIVFEAVPERASGFLSELRNLQGFKHFSLIAIVPQPYNPGGFLNLVFARRCLGEVKLPDRFGDDVEFVKHEGPTATAIYFVSGVTPKLKDRFIDQILATLKANELSAISLERH